jgi:hypothetical protein
MTLTEATFWTKRFGIIAGIFIGVFVLIIVLLTLSEKITLPPEYLTSNFGCTETKEEFVGKELSIPSLELRSDSEKIYQLNTDSGKVDSLPRIVNLYRYIILGQSLNSLGDAKLLAQQMGFDPEKVARMKTTDYLWVDNTTGRNLDIKARDLNFVMKTNVEKVREVNKNLDLPSEKEAPSIAINALRSLGLLDESYNSFPPTTHLIDINPDGTYTQAQSLLDAELIRVDFYRKVPMITIPTNIQGAKEMVDSLTKKNLSYEIDGKIVNDEKIDVYNFSTLVTYNNPVKSNISVYVGPQDDSVKKLPNIYQIEYTNWPIEETSCGTYELIAPSTALEKIQSGEGSLVYLNYNSDEVAEYIPQTVKKFIVDDIYITYYEGYIEQEFLQPVYMVEGQALMQDGSYADFHIYYPAINYGIVQDKVELPKAPQEDDNFSIF